MGKSQILEQIERAQEMRNRYFNQARFLRQISEDGRQNIARRVCLQAAWNERRSLRYWQSEYAMTPEEIQAREVERAIIRLSNEIVFWRDAMHCKAGELVTRIRCWERVGDMAYSRTTRGAAVAAMLEIYG